MTFDLMTQTHAAPFVVLSPGNSGANYVAAALQQLGVPMGNRFLWTDPENPGAYEDMALRDLNSSCLARKISAREWLFKLLDYCDLRGRSGVQWGMSDPRLCDLAPWLRHALPHGRFIRVRRPVRDAIAECHSWYGCGAGDKVASEIIIRRVRQLDEHFQDVGLDLDYRQARDQTVLFSRLTEHVKRKAYNLAV